MAKSDFDKAAEWLGWSWSAAHGGLINDSHRRTDSPGRSDYFVACDAEDACFQDGIETEDEARAYVTERAAASGEGP